MYRPSSLADDEDFEGQDDGDVDGRQHEHRQDPRLALQDPAKNENGVVAVDVGDVRRDVVDAVRSVAEHAHLEIWG